MMVEYDKGTGRHRREGIARGMGPDSASYRGWHRKPVSLAKPVLLTKRAV